jgi:Heparinase II/III-like protein/Heparinase II/III N-terminus
MHKAAWYWHRLRAMSPQEVARHAMRRRRQFVDARRARGSQTFDVGEARPFPQLPNTSLAPAAVRAALASDVQDILTGSWRAFGSLALRVDDPPRWHYDYLAAVDVAGSATSSAFTLDHRTMPDGADIKLVWELSRWSPLVRLAMGAYILDDAHAAGKCVDWLDDWALNNPPYAGWNWTSALEVGIRLIQFTWIDALLSNVFPVATSSSDRSRLASLRCRLLRPHASFCWRYRSFGSSANNHLLGELAGLIVASGRWPSLERTSAPLRVLQQCWEREVLAQFGADGGNHEQALNYQLFSFELCWQAMAALDSAGCVVSARVLERLRRAAAFYASVQVDTDRWDYGDSDDAFVTPFSASDTTAAEEWRQWFIRPTESPHIDYWLGHTRDGLAGVPNQSSGAGCPEPCAQSQELLTLSTASDAEPCWISHREAGQAVCRAGPWTLRADLSPLGYLTTAAHGHLDALHLSLWFGGVAIVVDPGTGAYYADPELRTWLASRPAHNAPCPSASQLPKRLGPFLWDQRHQTPIWSSQDGSLISGLAVPDGRLNRTVSWNAARRGWEVIDSFEARAGTPPAFDVRWQFAPGTSIERLDGERFLLARAEHRLLIEISKHWSSVSLVHRESERGADAALAGLVSPRFRQVCFAPYLLLRASELGTSDAYRTTFLCAGNS